ncbi:hypothetical protein HZS_7593 [Henneguya salminicola]|nr:hypothetical protein HZS_7593 [Henneguya salminicola]
MLKNVNTSTQKNSIDTKKEDTISIENDESLTNFQFKKLHEYQQKGVLWLIGLFNRAKGGILADDMGLGKTAQTAVFLHYLFLKNLIKFCLLVVPKSIIVNWISELNTWCPSISIEVYKAGDTGRAKKLSDIHVKGGILITTYGLTQSSHVSLSKTWKNTSFKWDILVIDEAQKIKNTNSTSKNIRLIPTNFRLALSGTPLQNNLMALYELLNNRRSEALVQITILRLISSHPILVTNWKIMTQILDAADKEWENKRPTNLINIQIERSSKLAFLSRLIVRLIAEDCKILIFSQSRSMLDLIGVLLKNSSGLTKYAVNDNNNPKRYFSSEDLKDLMTLSMTNKSETCEIMGKIHGPVKTHESEVSNLIKNGALGVSDNSIIFSLPESESSNVDNNPLKRARVASVLTSELNVEKLLTEKVPDNQIFDQSSPESELASFQEEVDISDGFIDEQNNEIISDTGIGGECEHQSKSRLYGYVVTKCHCNVSSADILKYEELVLKAHTETTDSKIVLENLLDALDIIDDDISIQIEARLSACHLGFEDNPDILPDYAEDDSIRP